MADAGSRGTDHLDALSDRFGMARRPFGAVLALTALALLARLVALGARPMHFDEGRVAFWGLRAVREGLWTYQPVVHGPLMQHLNRWTFAVAGSGDFVARLPVALVGGLLPLSALLYREHLRDLEVAALAGLLAVNPLLLYYSRFLRSDLLVAAFAFLTLGLLVRLVDTWEPAALAERDAGGTARWFAGRAAYLWGAVAAFALAFASKENAFVYVLCWGGMLGLVAGLELFDPRRFASRRAMLERAGERVAAPVRRLLDSDAESALLFGGATLAHLWGAVLVFGLLIVFLFARRAPPGDGVGLWHSAPTTVLTYVVADVVCGLEFWLPIEAIPVPRPLLPEPLVEQTCHGFASSESALEHYGRDLGRELQVLGKTAVGVVVLALVGMLAEFRRSAPRVLVPAAFYWAAASLVGYPVGADIIFPAWVTIHAVVPLTIPAAAGAVALGEWTRDAVVDGDPLTATSLSVAVLLLTGSIAGVGVHHAYVAPTGTHWSSEGGQMVQFAQPEQEMNAALAATRRASAETAGTDVLVYESSPGDTYALVDMGGANDHAVACMKFLYTLPLSWYFYSWDAEVTCAEERAAMTDAVQERPPVIVTRVGSAPPVKQQLGDDYVSATYELRRGGREVVFFFDTTRVDPPARALAGSGSWSTAPGEPGPSDPER